MTKRKKHYIFTMTQGKTGTYFLTSLLENNLADCEVHHEILGYDKFGIDTPNISTFTLFNSQGNVREVQSFWEKKLKKIAKTPHKIHIETSHLLIKAGLIENLDFLPSSDIVHFIILKRDIIKILKSYQNSFDFLNKGNMWLWYLDPDYPKIIVNPKHFAFLGIHGVRLWYIYEIETRIEYYKSILKGRKNIFFHTVNIDDLNNEDKVKKLIKDMKLKPKSNQIFIPPKLNVSRQRFEIKENILNNVRDLIESLPKPSILAKRYIKNGGGWN